MSEPGEEDDKQFEPTQKKLDDARQKGDVARSADLTNAAAYGGFVLVGLSFGGLLIAQLGNNLTALLASAPELATDIFNGGSQAQFGSLIVEVLASVSPWFLAPAIAALLAIVSQQSFVVAPSKLEPKISRISILSNAKNKFGRQGLFEFFKSFSKLLIYSGVLGYFLTKQTPRIIQTVTLDPVAIAPILTDTSLSFIILILVVASSIGAVDYFWQNAEHIRKNRMSHKEMTDEAKQMEGDPHVKQQRRQKGHEIAMNRMLADVPGADVVIVNPSHFAVALKWSRTPGSAPSCVAKGVDEVAARIREAANEHGVPIHRDPPTARALFATVNIGEQILPEHFRAVAAAIRFAEDISSRSRSHSWAK